MTGAGVPAVFLDRDGTLIREGQYLSDPAEVELLPGTVDALAAFEAAGYAVVVVTNQSGIARGYYDEAAYREVEAEVERRLAAGGIRILATYHCPHHPDLTGVCDCRKPATALFRQAAREHDLDLQRSIYIGDRLRDVLPATELGGTGILVRTGYGAEEEMQVPSNVRVADDLNAAAVVAGVAP